MARLVKGTVVEFEDLKRLGNELLDFPKSTRRKYFRAAFNAAAKVGVAKLKQITPKGPTGNLKKFTAIKATSGYGLAGYKRGPRRSKKNEDSASGYHASLLEFGTKPRKTKGRIASTFGNKGKGRGGAMRIVVAKRGKFAGMTRTKSPAFPKSFFKSAVAGQKVQLGRMPVGGRLGKPPVKTAFEQARSGIATVLREQAATAYERASKDLARNFPPKGTT
jgi:hypothetical protein